MPRTHAIVTTSMEGSTATGSDARSGRSTRFTHAPPNTTTTTAANPPEQREQRALGEELRGEASWTHPERRHTAMSRRRRKARSSSKLATLAQATPSSTTATPASQTATRASPINRMSSPSPATSGPADTKSRGQPAVLPGPSSSSTMSDNSRDSSGVRLRRGHARREPHDVVKVGVPRPGKGDRAARPRRREGGQRSTSGMPTPRKPRGVTPTIS